MTESERVLPLLLHEVADECVGKIRTIASLVVHDGDDGSEVDGEDVGLLRTVFVEWRGRHFGVVSGEEGRHHVLEIEEAETY